MNVLMREKYSRFAECFPFLVLGFFFQLLIFFQFDTFIFSLFGIQLNNLVWIFSQY